MNIPAQNPPKLSMLALCLIMAACLPACSGGGGIVRSEQPPSPPPPPPPPPPETFCPPPVTGDCVVNPPYTLTFNENYMSGGRQSDHALIVHSTGDGWLTLFGEYRFDGGTAIERGTLILDGNSTLISDTTVSPLGEFWLGGTLRGDLANDGRVVVGQMQIAPENWAVENFSRIEGDYRQSANGTLSFTLGWPLQITGQARLDGGTAELHAQQVWNGARHVYYFPSTPSSQALLHADGGVFGQFDTWTSPGLFIEGSLRYAPNDVYFELTRISVQGVMATARAGDAATLETAGNVDHAFLASDAYAALPQAALTTTQRRFLQSAASIQNLDHYAQAVRTLDSLSGHGHVAAATALMQQVASAGARSSNHALAVPAGSQAGAWGTRAVLPSAGSGWFHQAHGTGYDQWLDDRLLLGGSFGWGDDSLQFDRAGGNSRSESSQWNLYLHRRGDKGAYATGGIGYGRQRLSLDRPIDLGETMHGARSTRALDVTDAYVEAGRELSLREGRLAAFVGMNHAMLRSDGFIEQGDTGFELLARPSLHRRTAGDAGVRYSRHWRRVSDRWVQLDFGAGYQHLLGASDELRAAYTGTPGVEFNVHGLPRESGDAWLELNIAGGGDRWSWLLSYDNRDSRQAIAFGVEHVF